MQRIAILLVVCAASFTGCAHHQLRRNTVKQADTVADIHTQQVLDNLAKFAHNPGALPHFSYPQGGSSSVNDNVGGSSGFNFSPAQLMGWNFGINGQRTSNEAFTMVPINDPRKLELMRCAYQKAVAQCCLNGGMIDCPDCEKRFNSFYLGSTSPLLAQQQTVDGHPMFQVFDQDGAKLVDGLAYSKINEYGETEYWYLHSGKQVPSDQSFEFKAIRTENPLLAHTLQTGKVTTDCLESECWFNVCNKKPHKHSRCCLVGEYCGTYVTVPDCHRDKLARLTLVILDIAQNDPPEPATKEVVAYLDRSGNITECDNAAYEVTATIGLTSSIDAVAKRDFDPSTETDEGVRVGIALQNEFSLLKKFESDNPFLKDLHKNTTLSSLALDISEPITKSKFEEMKSEKDADQKEKIDLFQQELERYRELLIRQQQLQNRRRERLEKAATSQQQQIDAARNSGSAFRSPRSNSSSVNNILLLDQNLRALTPNQ